jgi:hypothetical protein
LLGLQSNLVDGMGFGAQPESPGPSGCLPAMAATPDAAPSASSAASDAHPNRGNTSDFAIGPLFLDGFDIAHRGVEVNRGVAARAVELQCKQRVPRLYRSNVPLAIHGWRRPDRNAMSGSLAHAAGSARYCLLN